MHAARPSSQRGESVSAGRVRHINPDTVRQLAVAVLIAAAVLLVTPVRTANAQSGAPPTVISRGGRVLRGLARFADVRCRG